MNGTRCDIRLAMNATSRDSRSSEAIANSHFSRLANASSAALSSGRRSSASNPLPLSTSVNSAMTSKPSAAAKAATRPGVGHQDRGLSDLASGSRLDSKRRGDARLTSSGHTDAAQYVHSEAFCKLLPRYFARFRAVAMGCAASLVRPSLIVATLELSAAGGAHREVRSMSLAGCCLPLHPRLGSLLAPPDQAR